MRHDVEFLWISFGKTHSNARSRFAFYRPGSTTDLNRLSVHNFRYVHLSGPRSAAASIDYTFCYFISRVLVRAMRGFVFLSCNFRSKTLIFRHYANYNIL